MNPEKAEKLFALMKQYGVEYFKHDELEIKLTPGVEIAKAPAITPKKTKKVPVQAAPPVEMPIPHHVNEVANLLKLSDNDLVDKMFPDYSQQVPDFKGAN